MYKYVSVLIFEFSMYLNLIQNLLFNKVTKFYIQQLKNFVGLLELPSSHLFSIKITSSYLSLQKWIKHTPWTFIASTET